MTHRRLTREESRTRSLDRMRDAGLIADWSVTPDSAGHLVYELELRRVSRTFNRWEVDAFLLGAAVQRSAGESA